MTMAAGSRNEKRFRAEIARGFERAYRAETTETVDRDLDDLRLIVFSDQHKGSRDGADDFRRCEPTYNAAMAWYLEEGYTLAILGDGEELWECTAEEVLPAYAHTLALEAEFHRGGRYWRFWGNHDDLWQHEHEVKRHLRPIFPGLEMREAMKIRVLRDGAAAGTLFLIHGHQGTADSDRFGWASRVVVHRVWRPLQRKLDMPSTTPARDWELRAAHEAAMFTWARNHPDRPVAITGHTHRPVFGFSRPEPKIERSPEEVRAELDALRATTPVDAARAAALCAELEYVLAEQRRVTPPTPIAPPCFFNTGCCSFGDGNCTGIELADGEIRLVRWASKGGTPGRDVLAHDALDRVLSAVSGKKAVPA